MIRQVGQGRFQTAAIVQLAKPMPDTKEELRAIKESLAANIAAANVQAPAHAQLHKDYIMFASDDKPFILAGKETVLRAMTVKLYESEIDEFYAQQELSQPSESVSFDISTLESTQIGIQNLLCRTLAIDTLGKDDDIFAAGVDSLSVLKILASLRNTLQATNHEPSSITASMIYTNPTIERLSKALWRASQSGDVSDSAAENIELMKSLLEKYTSALPERSLSKETKPQGSGIVVILTGSTGSLGSYLLDTLLSNPRISKVFCLNRSVKAYERQTTGNKFRGLKADLTSNRVEFLHADLSRPSFGLDAEKYNELLKGTTHIIRKHYLFAFSGHS